MSPKSGSCWSAQRAPPTSGLCEVLCPVQLLFVLVQLGTGLVAVETVPLRAASSAERGEILGREHLRSPC